jgi:WD40 repeat protein
VAVLGWLAAAPGYGSGGSSTDGNVAAGILQSRIRYFDTAQDLTPDLNFNSQPHVLYNPATKRFFVADAEQNHVLVYDATVESQVADIVVPGAWALDQSQDQKIVYVGTQVGNIYLIDPVAMTVTQVIPASAIGPSGYPTYAVRALADGRLALLGGQGGIPEVDGYASLAIWNPADNSFEEYTTQYHASSNTPGQVICGSLITIAYLAVTPDRTKLMLGSPDSDATVCQFDPSSGNSRTVTAPGELYSGASSVFLPPDGKEFLTTAQGSVYVYNSATMQLQDQFTIADMVTSSGCILSFDGTLFYTFASDTGALRAYNWRTHAFVGWASSPSVTGYFTDLHPLAIDETGLIAGLLGYGVGFADAKALSSGTFQAFASADVLPNLGPPSGGTTVQFFGLQGGQTAVNIFFGTQAGSDLSLSSPTLTASAPQHAPGAVDVTLETAEGGLVSAYEGFSYGPSIVKILTQTSTAEGGATETVFGYGLGPAYTGVPSDLEILVGTQPVTITAYNSDFHYGDGGSPTPLEVVQFKLPPGSPNSSADLTISNSSGTTTVQKAISYIAPVQTFPLPGAQLFQGIYDPKRNVYYLTDQAQIWIFSAGNGSFTPIAMPKPPGATKQRLVGISLSPDGRELAAADAAADAIYVLNLLEERRPIGRYSGSPLEQPAIVARIETFPLPAPIYEAGTEQPCGLAISNQRIVYYASFDGIGTGAPSFHKLDARTGVVTDYPGFTSGNGPGDFYARVALTNDGQRVFYSAGALSMIDTSSGAVSYPLIDTSEDYELALSANGIALTAGESLFNISMDLNSYLAGNELQSYDEMAVYGEKLSPDGRYLFAPLINSIEAFDGDTGVLLSRVGLPIGLSPNYDALVSDGGDNLVLMITGTGDGVALVDLSFIQNLTKQSGRVAGRNRGAEAARPAVSAAKRRLDLEASAGKVTVPRPQGRYLRRFPSNNDLLH